VPIPPDGYTEFLESFQLSQPGITSTAPPPFENENILSSLIFEQQVPVLNSTSSHTSWEGMEFDLPLSSLAPAPELLELSWIQFLFSSLPGRKLEFRDRNIIATQFPDFQLKCNELISQFSTNTFDFVEAFKFDTEISSILKIEPLPGVSNNPVSRLFYIVLLVLKGLSSLFGIMDRKLDTTRLIFQIISWIIEDIRGVEGELFERIIDGQPFKLLVRRQFHNIFDIIRGYAERASVYPEYCCMDKFARYTVTILEVEGMKTFSYSAEKDCTREKAVSDAIKYRAKYPALLEM